jgi:hypothetical protein
MMDTRESTLQLAREFGIEYGDGTFEFDEDSLIRFVDVLCAEIVKDMNASVEASNLCPQCPAGDPCSDKPECDRKKDQALLNALHRTDSAGYANLAEPHPTAVQDKLHDQDELHEIYEFSDGSAKIMTLHEFDQEHGKELRVQLEQARANRRLNHSQCDDTFKA